MRTPDHWRAQWVDLPPELTYAQAAQDQDLRERRGFLLAMTWPVILFLLQGAIYAPLFAMGFLNSPYANSAGAELTTQREAPPREEPPVVVTPGEDQATPAPTLTPPVAAAATPSPTPMPSVSNPPATTPRGTSRPTPAPTATRNPVVPPVAPPVAPPVDTPRPTSQPKPPTEVVELDLEDGDSTPVTSGSLRGYPGTSSSFILDATNRGNVPLGNLTLRASSSNPLFSESTQGLRVYVWACSGAWGGTAAKPLCSGTLTAGGMFPLAQGSHQLPFGVVKPGESKALLLTLHLPKEADNRYQGQSTIVTTVVNSTQTGGVAQ